MEKINDIWKEYKKINLINENSFSKIYKAKNKTTNQYVAIKEIQKSKINIQNISTEIDNWKKLKSENKVELIDKFETKQHYYIIMELCYISIDEYLKLRKDPLSIEEIKEILLELNKCFKKMNEKKIIHKNIKLSNIFLSINKSKINKICFKISDFGLNKLSEECKINKKSSNENSNIISTKVLKEKINLNSDKNDIWNLGIIIYYMLFKEYPYKRNTECLIIKRIDDGLQIKKLMVKF